MASVSGPTNPNAINWSALAQQPLTGTTATPLGAGEFAPEGQSTAHAGGLPAPRQFDLEGMLAELRSKLDGETFRSKIEEVKAQIQASRAQQLGGLFGAMNDQWMATGASLETQAEYRQNGVSWWDKQRAVQALDQSGLSHWEASQLVETAEAAMRGDVDAQAKLSQLVGTLRDSIGLDRFAGAMQKLGQMMGSQWGWPLGGKTDDSMNTMLRGLMNTLAAAGSQAFGAIGGAIVADTLLPAMADRYAENAYEDMRWQGGFWQMNWADQQASKDSLKAGFMLKMGAQVGAMTRQNDPLAGFNASLLGFYGPLGALGQHAMDRQASAAAWEGPIREARYTHVSSSDERAVESMLRSAGLDAGTADRLGTAVRAKLRGDPNADNLMRMALAGLSSQGFGNFESILQRLGQAIKSRQPGDDGQLLMLRGVMNAMAVGGTAAFGPIGGIAVQGLLAGPMADAIANDRRDWNYGGFPYQPFQRPREKSATQLRMEFAQQLGGLTRLTANPFPSAAFSPLVLPWVGRMDDFMQSVRDQRGLQADGFQLAQAARQLGVQPWHVDNVMSRLQGSGMDWQTSRLAGEAVQSLLSGSPDAASKMQMLGQRLAAGGPQALQQLLGSLARALPGLGGDPQTALVLNAMTRVLTGAAGSAFGRMGGDVVMQILGLPQAQSEARRHLERMEGAGMLQGMSPIERQRLENDFIARALQPELGALGAYARLGIDRSPFAPMEAMFPQLGFWMASALDLPLAERFRFEAAPTWRCYGRSRTSWTRCATCCSMPAWTGRPHSWRWRRCGWTRPTIRGRRPACRPWPGGWAARAGSPASSRCWVGWQAGSTTAPCWRAWRRACPPR